MAERTFVLPDLGEGLEEAEISAWLVTEGEEIALNHPFVEVETAKATVEIPAPFAGRVVRIHAAAGDTVKVGSPLVTFDVAEATPTPGTPRSGATPAVRKLAKDLGVDLSTIEGSGPDGRVSREDVERAASAGAAPETDVEVEPLSPLRRAIAENLSRAAAIPQVTTFRTVDCTELERVRAELDLSPLPLFVRALVEVVASHPRFNAEWRDDGTRIHRKVHVGIAVDTDKGLVVPVVRDASARSVGELAEEIARLARAAREGSLDPHDTGGATISVSNTGSYGSESGTVLLNPPGAVTIGLGVISPRALVVDGRVEARPACMLSCTFDHRVLDGAEVGRALGDLVAILQDADRLRALAG